MKYCHSCGCKLSLGIENYCPNCGLNLTQKRAEIEIKKTNGDVIGAGIEGTGNIIGKKICYTVQGNIIHFHLSGNISKEVIDSLQKIMNAPTQIDQKSLTKDIAYDKDIKNKLDETNNAQQQITSILQEVDNIGKKEGTQPIEVIRSENIQISRKELLLKEHILKGNGYLYKKEYNNAIQCYDKALELEPNSSEVWNNKGLALYILVKHDEAIQCYDKALELEPNNDRIIKNRNLALKKQGKTEKSSG